MGVDERVVVPRLRLAAQPALAGEAGLGPDDYAVLYSTFEFKKVRLKYYSPAYRAWEDLAMAGEPLPTG